MSLRLFAALEVPDDVAERLLALMRGVPGARWRSRAHLHLTVCFFDDVREPVAEDLDTALEEVGQTTAPFELQLRAAGFFGGADPRALWAGVAPNDALKALAAECARAARRCGLKLEARKFSPHVTLAYLRGSTLDRVIAFEKRLALFQSRPWTADSLVLFSSHVRARAPSLYREEAVYPLRG